MISRRSIAARWLTLPALLLLFGGLVVEIHIRGKEARARESLGGALGRATLPITAGEHVREMFEEARALVRSQDPSAALTLLDRIATQAPHSTTHELAALAYRAAGHGDAATRHMQFAARLAPDDKRLATQAERSLDLALFDRARPYARVAITGCGALLFVFLLGGLGRRRRDGRMRKYLDNVSARLKLVVDDRGAADAGIFAPEDETLIIDLFLKGRYGIRPNSPPRRGPTLHLACSNATSNRTVRITPVRNVRNDAVRVHVKPETLRRLRAHPGRWRIQATLGDRRVAIAELTVLPEGAALSA